MKLLISILAGLMLLMAAACSPKTKFRLKNYVYVPTKENQKKKDKTIFSMNMPRLEEPDTFPRPRKFYEGLYLLRIGTFNKKAPDPKSKNQGQETFRWFRTVDTKPIQSPFFSNYKHIRIIFLDDNRVFFESYKSDSKKGINNPGIYYLNANSGDFYPNKKGLLRGYYKYYPEGDYYLMELEHKKKRTIYVRFSLDEDKQKLVLEGISDAKKFNRITVGESPNIISVNDLFDPDHIQLEFEFIPMGTQSVEYVLFWDNSGEFFIDTIHVAPELKRRSYHLTRLSGEKIIKDEKLFRPYKKLETW
jgi:hypothetical protein